MMKNIDFFGRPVQFTFKGQQHFKSYLGGVASVVCYVVIFFIFVLQTIELFAGED